MRLPLVYIAGPFSKPDPIENTHNAIDMAETLLVYLNDIVPVIPHLTLLWHLQQPHPVDFWYALDIELLARCDALFRMEGKSVGADAETEFAREHNIPIFETAQGLSAWTAKWFVEQAEANGE